MEQPAGNSKGGVPKLLRPLKMRLQHFDVRSFLIINDDHEANPLVGIDSVSAFYKVTTHRRASASGFRAV